MIERGVKLQPGDVLREDARPNRKIILDKIDKIKKRWMLTPGSNWGNLDEYTIRKYFSAVSEVTQQELDEVKSGLEQWLNG